MNPSLIGKLAGLIAFISFFPYFDGILKRKVKPQRTTFAIWSFVNVVTILGYVAAGARDTAWVALAYGTLQFVVFFLSFKYGMGGTNKLDIFCFIGGVIAAFFWFTTKNPLYALYIGVLMEAIGYIPTIKKSYLFPETESKLSWSIAVVGTFINLFAITRFTPEIMVYPIYAFLGDLIITVLILFPNTRYGLKTE